MLDRWSDVYPQPRAVHLDDEIFRIVARLGIAEEFAAISRPALGLRLLDNATRVLAEFHRDTGTQRAWLPAGEHVRPAGLRGAVARTTSSATRSAELRGDVEVTDIADDGQRTDLGDLRRSRRWGKARRRGDYVLGLRRREQCGARSRIGVGMRDLKFDQRWLVVDIATYSRSRSVGGRAPGLRSDRAATYMRIGDTRYRWEFQMLAVETADDFAASRRTAPAHRSVG